MKSLIYVWILLAGIFCWDMPILAAPLPPKTINYQGYLKDSGGVPVNGLVNMSLILYDADSGGTSLWEENRDVLVSNGLYTIKLGEIKSLNLSFDKQYWLGIFIGGSELLPRQQLSHTPYAFRSTVADTVSDKSITAAKIGQVCADGEVLRYDSNSFSWTCSSGTPGPTGPVGPPPVVSTNAGLLGTGSTASPLTTDTDYLQRRVIGGCADGSAVSQVNSDGTVVCKSMVNSFPNSLLINHLDGEIINHWVGNPRQTWTLCYRRSSHGPSSQLFHTLCDNMGQTVTVLSTSTGRLIGGYANCSWRSINGYNNTCAGSFLFSLTNGHRYDKGGIYHSLNTTLYDSNSQGPTFGGGHDFYINGVFTSGYCNLGHSYTCRKGDYGSPACQNDFCGGYNWTVMEAEVWYVNR